MSRVATEIATATGEAMAVVVGTWLLIVLALVAIRTALQKRDERVLTAPGLRTARILTLVFGSRAFKHYFAQTVADAQQEFVEAVMTGDKALSMAIKIRTPLQLLMTAAVYPLAWTAKQVETARKIFKSAGD